MTDQRRIGLSAHHMAAAAEDQRMAVANDGILDRAIDCGKRAFKCQCAGRKSRPGRYGRQARTAATPTATSKPGSV